MAALILGIVMFMLLVLVHELGHFITAKKSGIKVEEFGIGIPPKVLTLGKDKSGTIYTLNLIPLGGFVRLKGEDPNDPDTFKARDSFLRAKFWQKIIVLIAGVFMNTLFAWIIFTTIFTLGTKPIQIIGDNMLKANITSYLTPTKHFLYSQGLISGDTTSQEVKIESIYSNSLAEKIGLTGGDIILAINDTQINSRNIEKTLKDNIGKSFDITYQRHKKNTTTSVTCPSSDCLLGITYTSSIDYNSIKQIKFPLPQAMLMGIKEIGNQTTITLGVLKSFGKNIISFQRTKIKESLNKMTGPAGAIKIGEAILIHGGWKLYLGFAGMISLALAIFNILPIPALDGGRLLGILIQKGLRLKEDKYFNIEGYINLVFFILLIGLGIYILLQDLVRARNVHIPFMG